MSFCITSIPNNYYFSGINAINLSISERGNNNSSISLTSNFKKSLQVLALFLPT